MNDVRAPGWFLAEMRLGWLQTLIECERWIASRTGQVWTIYYSPNTPEKVRYDIYVGSGLMKKHQQYELATMCLELTKNA